MVGNKYNHCLVSESHPIDRGEHPAGLGVHEARARVVGPPKNLELFVIETVVSRLHGQRDWRDSGKAFGRLLGEMKLSEGIEIEVILGIDAGNWRPEESAAE